MFLIGLTGGIAAGKTTVAERLVQFGAVQIDADVLARQAVEKGSQGLLKVVDAFGKDVLNPEGDLNRQALADIVFKEPSKRVTLESIVHPIVRNLASQAVLSQPEDAIVVYTVPLLVEAGVDLPFDFIITVEAPLNTQVERMVKSRGMSSQQALDRIASQATAAQRANRADVILNSNQSFGQMIDDVDALWHVIQRRATQKRDV